MKKPRKARLKKVWRIFRFQERFELKDDSRFCRKGPLQFTRGYVGSGQTDEAINFKTQITICRARPKPERQILKSSFEDLLDIAANHSRSIRGYLLDAQFEPASISKIASWLGLNITECNKTLKELEQIGLIEKVSMPDFDPTLNELPEKQENESSQKPDKPKKPGTQKGDSRAPTRKNEKSRAPLKKRKSKTGSGNGKVLNKNQSGKEPEKANIPEEVKAKPNTTAQAISEGIAEQQDKPATNPTNPKESDGGMGGENYNQSPSRMSLAQQQHNQPQCLDAFLHKLYNTDADEFAHAVYQAIGTRSRNDQEKNSEIGCWRMAWAKAQLAGIGPAYLTALWNRTIIEAEKLNRKRICKSVKFTNSPEAVLRDLFKKFLRHTVQQAKQAEDNHCEMITRQTKVNT